MATKTTIAQVLEHVPLADRPKMGPAMIWNFTGADFNVPLELLVCCDGAAPKTARAHIRDRSGDKATLCGWVSDHAYQLRQINAEERLHRRACKACVTQWELDRLCHGGRKYNAPPPLGELALAYPDPEPARPPRKARVSAPKECNCATAICRAQREQRRKAHG